MRSKELERPRESAATPRCRPDRKRCASLPVFGFRGRCHTAAISDRSAERRSKAARPAERERSITAWLLAACLVGLVTRLIAGTYLDLDHNGAWHVFIARFLSREWSTPAHPPLFPALLAVPVAVSRTLLSYRIIPILAGLGSVFLIGRVLLALGTLPVVAVLGALTFACAQSATVLSLAVESYMLTVFLILVSFLFALDLVRAGESPPLRSRVAFAVFASLALLSHYFAAFYLAALAASVLVACAIRPDYRRRLRTSLAGRWRADLLTAAPPILIGAGLYWFLVRPWAGIPLGNFDPTRISPGAYLLRGLRRTVSTFAPLEVSGAAAAGAVLALFLAVVIWTPATEREEPAGRTDVRRLLPSLILLALLVLGASLGVTGRYPFGGSMRHQFLNFVFALLAGYVAFDRLLRARLWSPNGRRVLVATAVAAIGADVALNTRGYTTPAIEILEAKRGIYRKHLAGARTVHLDRLDLIGLMMEYYRWDWSHRGDDPRDATVRRYALSLDGERLLAVAHWRWWRFDYLDPAIYAELAATWDEKDGPCQSLFAVYQNIYLDTHRITPEKRAEVESRIRALAEAAGFEVQSLAVDDDDVSAELCRRR